jgi:molecular chaperone GrpE
LTHIKITEEEKENKTEKAEDLKEGAEKAAPADLEARLQEKEKEAKDNYDRFLRLSAELENYKKRMEKEKSETYRFANECLIKEMLPVLDNLERALEHGRKAEDPKAVLEGVEMTHKGFKSVLEKYGVTRVEALGEEFDPNRHEAVMVQEDAGQLPGRVISELQTGYLLHDRLVRPAMVVVSKKPEINPDEDPDA